MKIHFKNFVALALSVMLVAEITSCKNELDPGNIPEAPKGEIILDNEFVTIRLLSTEARSTKETVPYTKDDWAYNTTTVTFAGTNATTSFYSKNSSITVECKKEGTYTFKSTAYKDDKETIVATSDSVIRNVTFANDDFHLIITYTNINSYEVITGVTGTIENQWDEQVENLAVLSSDWFNNENAPSKDNIKSISFIKADYTGSYNNTWSGGKNITVYYNSDDESIVVSAAGRTIYAPEDSSYLFRSFELVETIALSNFDTSKVTDMSLMFMNCSSLTSLDVSNFDTSNVTNMAGMFSLCESLTSLDVSNFDTSNVTNMSCIFFGCRKLSNLDVSNFDTSKVTGMSWMFSACSSLSSLDVSNFDTSKVTDMSLMFMSCSSLTSLDVSNFNTSNVTNMTNMFDNCKGLTSLDVSNFNTSNVTNMHAMFANCSSITSLDLRSFNTYMVTDMGWMFVSCSCLISLDVSNFDTSNVTNMDAMFANCEGLTSLDVSNFDTSKVTEASPFSGCENLKVTYNPTKWTLNTNYHSVTFISK